MKTMITEFKKMMWLQFGAAIDMLENAVTRCPVEVWTGKTMFWYKTYHTTFYLDYYLSYDPNSFAPPTPFTLSEFDPTGALPERVYSREELLGYIEFARKKCHDVCAGFTEENAKKRFINKSRDYSMLEMLVYNLRHVQHHVGQLNMVLRLETNSAPGWVSRTEKTP
jgi:hypothetical protein